MPKLKYLEEINPNTPILIAGQTASGKSHLALQVAVQHGGTIINAVDALKKNGAKEVYVFITHAVLSGEAAKKIKNSKIKKLIITDSIDNSNKIKNNNKIEVLSISSLMSEASDIKDEIDKTSILLLFLILFELSMESVIINFFIFEFLIFLAASPLRTACVMNT